MRVHDRAHATSLFAVVSTYTTSVPAAVVTALAPAESCARQAAALHVRLRLQKVLDSVCGIVQWIDDLAAVERVAVAARFSAAENVR